MGRTERKFYLLQVGFGWGWLIGPIYPLFLLSRGLNIFEMGAVLAIFFAVNFLCEVPTGAVADVYGRRVSFVLACFTRMLAFALYPFADSFMDCAILETVDALGTTLASGSLEAWAIDGMKAEGDDRPRDVVFARSNILVRTAMAVGGIGGAYLADIRIEIPWLLSAVGYAATGVYAIRAMEEPSRSDRPRFLESHHFLGNTMREGVHEARTEPLVRWMCILTFLVAATMIPVHLQWPPYLQEFNASGYWVFGWVNAAMCGGSALGSLFTTRVLERANREQVLTAGHLLRGGGILLAASADSVAPALAGILIGEVAFGAVQPAFQAWINEHIDDSRRATVLSVEAMSFTAGGSIGLIILGQVAQRAGISPAWVVAGLIAVISAPLFLRLGRVAARSTATERAPTESS